jgi:hypothetical protein
VTFSPDVDASVVSLSERAMKSVSGGRLLEDRGSRASGSCRRDDRRGCCLVEDPGGEARPSTVHSQVVRLRKRTATVLSGMPTTFLETRGV